MNTNAGKRLRMHSTVICHDCLIIRLVLVSVEMKLVYLWNEKTNKNVPLRLFSRYFTFIFHLSPAVSKKVHIFSYIFMETNYLIAYITKENKNVGVKCTTVTFAAMTFKTVLKNGNCKLILGFERMSPTNVRASKPGESNCEPCKSCKQGCKPASQ